MVWHVLKKDVRLLWPLSLAVVVVGALCALRTLFEGRFFQPTLDRLTFFLPDLLYLGIAIVAVTAVHQDSLSESQEDWLIRPISRWDLALSKVLFVLLTVNVPLLIIDVLQQLALHFPLSVSIGVAAMRALTIVLMLSVPALMLGAVTRSLVDAFVFGTASAIGFVLIFLFALSTLSPNVLGLGRAGRDGGMTWISVWMAGVVIIVGSAAALAVQYSTRRTLLARCIGLAAVLAAISTLVLLPSTVTLAIQESMWGPSKSVGIRLAFVRSHRARSTAEEPRLDYGIGTPITPPTAAAIAAMVASVNRQIEIVGFPLSISGLRPGEILVSDRIGVRLVATNGKVLYEGAGVCLRGANGGVTCSPNRLEVWATPGAGKDIETEERLHLPLSMPI